MLSSTHILIPRHAIGLFAAALLVAALWLCLRVVYFNGFYLEDAPGYVTDAAYAALGLFRARDYVTGLNVGTFLPVAVPLAIFGKSEVALSLWPLACSLLGMVSMGVTVTLLCGKRWGFFSALLYATYPGDIFFSTVVMPDAIQAGWLTFSVVLVLLASAIPARRMTLLLGAGAAMAFCHLIRANGPLLLPVGFAAVYSFARLWKRERAREVWRAMAIYLGGWLLVQGIEGVVYLWSVGDFLHRAHVVSRHYGTMQSIASWGLNTDPGTIPYSIFAPVLWMRIGEWRLNAEQSYHGLLFVFAVAALVLVLTALRGTPVTADRRLISALSLGTFWLAWPLLYHEFGSQSLTQFVPMHRLSRHLVVYAPGAIFLCAVSCAAIGRIVEAWQSVAWRRAAAASALVLLLIHLAFNWQGIRAASLAYHQVKRTYVRIREHLPERTRTIVGDPGDLCFFDFWLNPLGADRVRVVPFANVPRCEDLVTGVVLTRASPGWDAPQAPIIRDTVARLPCLVAPPPAWRLLYDGFRERVFVIDAPSEPAAPPSHQ